MKAELYGIQSHAGWNWTCTLDFDTDRSYRLRQCDGETNIIRCEPSFSLGQALWLKSRLDENCKQAEHLEKVRRELIQGMAELGFGQQECSKIQVKQHSLSQLEADASSFAVKCDLLPGFAAAFEGRSLLPEEAAGLLEACGLGELRERWASYAQAAWLEGLLEITNGIDVRLTSKLWSRTAEWRCRRCGSHGERLHWVPCLDCGGMCPYCEACLTMGRVRFCSALIQGRSRQTASLEDNGVHRIPMEKYGLSPAQTEACLTGLRFLEETGGSGRTSLHVPFGSFDPKGRDTLSGGSDPIDRPGPSSQEPPCFLIWAVTGAGKTEMIFPLIEYELFQGRNVLVATPRRDVVLELAPRMAKAFPEVRLVTLYGGSEQRWDRGGLTLATTHQLLRFWRCFDLVIIDELDAFPFHGSPMLEYAARKACKPGGRYILLSATPPAALRKEASRGRLAHVKVPVRYHRHPLPEPRLITAKGLDSMIRSGKLSRSLHQAIDSSLERGAQLFVFVPKIKQVNPFVALLRRVYPEVIVEGTSSKDDMRSDKVLDFRGKRIDLLVTTTILERGVTVPKTDVFILDADSPVFDESALVQMSGRAGRSMDDPAGRVYFAAAEKNRSQTGAISQIKSMNDLARQKGYLIGSEVSKR